MSAPKAKFSPYCKARGQNLAEFALTIPFVFVLAFFSIEAARAWYTYESVKIAAMDGVHACSAYHNEEAGRETIRQKLEASGIQGSGSCNQITNQHAYEATVNGQYEPIFGSMNFGLVNMPGINAFTITYTALKDIAVY